MSAGARSVSEAELLAYVDGELDRDRCRDVEASLGRDPSLAAQADLWRRQDELLRAAFSRIAAEPVPAALAGRGREPAKTGTPGVTSAAPLRIGTLDRTRVLRLRRERQTRMMAAILVAFLSGVLVMFVASRLLERRHTIMVPNVGVSAPILPDTARRLGLRALETQAAFAGRERPPLDIPGKEGMRIAALMRSLLGVPDAVERVQSPDLSPLGLFLSGARVAPGEQRPAIWLVYEGSAGEKVSLYATRLASPDSGPRYEEDDMAGTVFWTTSQYGFAVTGGRERERLARIASDVRAQLPIAR